MVAEITLFNCYYNKVFILEQISKQMKKSKLLVASALIILSLVSLVLANPLEFLLGVQTGLQGPSISVLNNLEGGSSNGPFSGSLKKCSLSYSQIAGATCTCTCYTGSQTMPKCGDGDNTPATEQQYMDNLANFKKWCSYHESTPCVCYQELIVLP